MTSRKVAMSSSTVSPWEWVLGNPGIPHIQPGVRASFDHCRIRFHGVDPYNTHVSCWDHNNAGGIVHTNKTQELGEFFQPEYVHSRD